MAIACELNFWCVKRLYPELSYTFEESIGIPVEICLDGFFEFSFLIRADDGIEKWIFLSLLFDVAMEVR